MRAGDRVTVAIESVAFGGDGVGRVEKMVLFAPFTVDGDVIEAEVATVKKRYVRARLAKIIAPSQHRITPVCSYYAACGGCQYQHIAYAHQLALKERQVADAFARIGKVKDPPVRKIVPSPAICGYRGKAEIHVQRRKGQETAIGFMDTKGERVVDIERCEIVHHSINERIAHLRTEAQAGIWAGVREKYILWSCDDADETRTETESGDPRPVSRIVKGKELIIPPEGFFQANTTLADRLVEEVIEACGLNGDETVVDCCCGSGFFSLFLAPGAKEIFGVEWDSDAVQCARQNLKAAGFSHAHVLEGDVGEILNRYFIAGGVRPDVMVLDPPRTGLAPEALSAVARLKPRRVVYVSCDPATQARDTRYLLDRGFILKYLQPLDMFPQTGHIEVVGRLDSAV